MLFLMWFCHWNESDAQNKKKPSTTIIKCNSLSSFWASQNVSMGHSRRIVHCGYFHLEQAWKKPEGSYPPPLLSEHPAHSSRPAADLAVFQ